MIELVFVSGPRSGETLPVERELVLGREGGDVTIEDPQISRRHAAVRPSDGGVEIEDYSSLNGTRVNGVRVDGRRPLEHGDVVQLGESSFEVRIEAERDPGATVLAPRADTPAPAPAPPPAAGPLAAEAASAPPPPQPFAPPGAGRRRRRAAATRRLGPLAVALALVAATAAALVLYFALR